MKHFASKKFTMTFLIIAATVLLALLDALTPVVGSIFTGAGVVYPAAQGYVDGKNR